MKRRKTQTKRQAKNQTKPRRSVPDPKTILSESELRSSSGQVYRLIRTTQTDPYDAPLGKGKSKR